MRRRILSAALAAMMAFSLTACGGSKTGAVTAAEDTTAAGSASGTTAETSAAPGSEAGKPVKIMFVNYGTQGDASISDIVVDALKDFCGRTGSEYNVYDCNSDASLLTPAMLDICGSGDYDLVITGYYNMLEGAEEAAAKYPDQKILLYDTEADYTDGKNANVRSVSSKQNECAFLAGALAALLTESDAELANPDKTVGYVGAAENTAILDFLVGYIEGVNYVDSSINVLYSFVGNWSDTAKAKELGLMQFQQGADVSFSVCGAAGLGVAEAAKQADAYNIGVDYDVAGSIKTTNPDTAEHVVTSAVKDFYTIMMKELDSIDAGTIQWGSHTEYDYADGGCQLVDNEYFEKEVPQDVKDQYYAITEKLAAGEIKVGTAIGASQEEIDQYKAEAAPF